MKPPANTRPKPTKSKMPVLVVVIASVVAVTGVIWGGVRMFRPRPTVNYAEQIAKPLERALTEVGGVKRCDSGDAGRVSDNTQPRYGATFELATNRAQAIATINKIANDNGYTLNHASLENRGSVPAADIYLDNWFYDTAAKPSPYRDLGAGKISLFFVVNNDGPIELSEISCKTDKPVRINSNADTSAVSIQVTLPAFAK